MYKFEIAFLDMTRLQLVMKLVYGWIPLAVFVLKKKEAKRFVTFNLTQCFQVTVLTTGHEKTRITVMLTACLKGNKLIPFVILPKKRKDPKLEAAFKNKLKISYGGTNKSWMDNGQAEIYVK